MSDSIQGWDSQGWFSYGIFTWPFMCPPGCAAECVTSLRFWPFLILHGGLFYFAALVITVMKSVGLWPKHNPIDERFGNTFFVAWHIPNIVACGPLSIIALSACQDLWSADPKLQYGTGQMPQTVSEAGLWFTSYLILDTIIIIVHGLGSREDYIHHGIFSIVSYITIAECCVPLTCAVLLAQEFSTPALNTFMLLRTFYGMDSLITKLTFLFFAVQFYAIRVVLNTANTILFALEVRKGLNGPSGFDISQSKRYLLLTVLVCATCLQLHWGRSIALKIVKALSGDSKSPKNSKKAK